MYAIIYEFTYQRLVSVNRTIFSSEQNVFSVLLKDAPELDDFIDSGNEFHRTGATTLKERSPCRLSLLLGTTSNCLSVERNERVAAWVVNISARYCGAMSCKQRYTSRRILNSILRWIGSQYSKCVLQNKICFHVIFLIIFIIFHFIIL